jgi:sugar phosphate isomerase/epimerase
LAFGAVLDTAVALGAPVIRVWAGTRDSKDADDAYVAMVAADAHRIGSLAADAGVRVAFEYHGGTIADNAPAALALLRAANHPNLSTLWQPSVGVTPAERLTSLQTVLPRVAHVHVFQWEHPQRFPLSDGAAEWETYLTTLTALDREVPLLLEFVENDAPAAYLRDAATLATWLA